MTAPRRPRTAGGGQAGVPLVAVAHGSRDPRAAAVVRELLDAVRLRRPWLRVHTSFLDHAPPSPARVLQGLGGDVAVVQPLLLTAAYHSKIDIPGVLAGVRRLRPRLELRTAVPLGPHPLLVGALERRLAEAEPRPATETGMAAGTASGAGEAVEIGDPGTAVVLVAAGSSDPAANATIAQIARHWRRAGWRDVVPAYASAARPAPAEAIAALRAAGAPRVVVASYFLAPGYFADKVRQEAFAAGADAVSPVLGAAPEVAELVLHRYDEAVQPVETARAG